MLDRQRCVLIGTAITAVLAASLALADESKQAKIARAMSAAPAAISKDATIVDVDGKVLQSGTNGWHCQPGLMPGDKHPVCNDEVWMKLMTAVGSKADFSADRVGISYMLQGDAPTNNADPFDTKRDPGEVWVQEVRPHVMVVVPDKKMLEGISDDPTNGGPYVMWKGTPYAHIMVPVGAHKQKQ